MPGEIAGVAIVPLILVLVQVLKGFGLDAKQAPLAAMAVGILIMVGNQAAQVVPAFQQWYQVLLWGIAAGLMAVGLYSGTKNTLGGQ